MSDTTSPCNSPYRLRSSNLRLQGVLSAGGPPSDVGSVAPAEGGQAYKLEEAGPASPVTSIPAANSRLKRAATAKNAQARKVIHLLPASVIYVLDPVLSHCCPYTPWPGRLHPRRNPCL